MCRARENILYWYMCILSTDTINLKGAQLGTELGKNGKKEYWENIKLKKKCFFFFNWKLNSWKTEITSDSIKDTY